MSHGLRSSPPLIAAENADAICIALTVMPCPNSDDYLGDRRPLAGRHESTRSFPGKVVPLVVPNPNPLSTMKENSLFLSFSDICTAPMFSEHKENLKGEDLVRSYVMNFSAFVL